MERLIRPSSSAQTCKDFATAPSFWLEQKGDSGMWERDNQWVELVNIHMVGILKYLFSLFSLLFSSCGEAINGAGWGCNCKRSSNHPIPPSEIQHRWEAKRWKSEGRWRWNCLLSLALLYSPKSNCLSLPFRTPSIFLFSFVFPFFFQQEPRQD